jgi:hypothetical protein
VVINGTFVFICEVNAPGARWFAVGHTRDRRTDGRGDTASTATRSAFHEATVSANITKTMMLLRIKMILSRFVTDGAVIIEIRGHKAGEGENNFSWRGTIVNQ